MKKLTHYLVAKPGGKDPLGLYDKALMIELIDRKEGRIIYRETNKIGVEYLTPEEVSDSDYEAIKLPEPR